MSRRLRRIGPALACVALIASCGSDQKVLEAEPEQTLDSGSPPADSIHIGGDIGGEVSADAGPPPVDFGPPPDGGGIPCDVASDCAGTVLLQACQKPVCAGGYCAAGPGVDGVPCDDGVDCTVNTICSSGSCGGGGTLCDDGNPCTEDDCGPEGCVQSPKTGTCDDGNPCSIADHCEEGHCVGGNSLCLCESDTDCLQWEDDNKCNGSLVCLGGVCQVAADTIVLCESGVAGECQVLGCEPATGQCGPKPAQNGAACSDSDVCTTPDTCQAGQCTSGPATCPCTDDATCLLYDDGDLCNGVMRCTDGQCQPDPGTVVLCEGGAGPCEAGGCDPKTGQCSAEPTDGAPCDDGDPCTAPDVCLEGQCSGQDKDCDDGNPCTADACGPAGQCASVPTQDPCDDGDPCTDFDHCEGGECKGGQDVCSCTKKADCLALEDGDPCTGTLTCVQGKCVVEAGTEVYCNPGQSTACATHECVQGVCQMVPKGGGQACDDGDPCTDGETCQSDGECGGVQSTCACSAVDFISCGSKLLWANDAFGSTKNVDAWSCAPGDYTGNEYAWEFTVKQPSAVTVTLDNEDGATDVLVLEDQGGGCSAEACLKAAVSKLNFVAQPGKLYYIVIDGKKGSAGKLDIEVECVTAVEVDCEDGKDDDDDGLFDCNDPDCDTDLACIAVESCTNGVDDDNDLKVDCQDPDCQGDAACNTACMAQSSAYCGLSTFWETGGADATWDVASYACTAQQYDGPEFVYSFDSTKSQWVTVTLPTSFFGHTIFVMNDVTGAGCNGANCVNSGVGEVGFAAQGGATYYIAIDGANNAKGAYQIKITCQ